MILTLDGITTHAPSNHPLLQGEQTTSLMRETDFSDQNRASEVSVASFNSKMVGQDDTYP